MLTIGELIDGRYRILEVLGSGAMGVVYKAQHTTLTHRMVALKVVHAQLTVDADFLERFEREAQSASRVDHPNAVTIYDYGRTEQGFPFLAMEFVDGPSLADHIAAHPAGIAAEEAVDIALQIAAALGAVHAKGIVHRDLKPENVVLTTSGAAKVLDFGIAKATEGTRLSKTGLAIGTPAYMAPEQWRGEELDGRADQYALGVILFQMLCGRGPFHSQSPTGYMHQHLMQEAPSFSTVQKRVRAPQALEAAVRRALEKDPARRYPGMAEFREALSAAVGAATAPPAKERRSRTGTAATATARRRSIALPAAAVVVLALVAGAAWSVPGWRGGGGDAGGVAGNALLPGGSAAASPSVARLTVASDAEGVVRVGGRDYPVTAGSPREITLAAGVYEVVIRSAADSTLTERFPTVRLAAGDATELSASFALALAAAEAERIAEDEAAREAELEAERERVRLANAQNTQTSRTSTQTPPTREASRPATPAGPSSAPPTADEIYAGAKALYDARDYAAAFAPMREAAGMGNANAQHWLGHMYSAGNGTRQDHAEAVRWFRRSGQQGNAAAQRDMGYAYYQGQGVEQSYEDAVTWYQRSAGQGDVPSQRQLGRMYVYGEGVPIHHAEAARLLGAAANRGDAAAQFWLGNLYELGWGVTASREDAIRWYRLAAEQGVTAAANKLDELGASRR